MMVTAALHNGLIQMRRLNAPTIVIDMKPQLAGFLTAISICLIVFCSNSVAQVTSQVTADVIGDTLYIKGPIGQEMLDILSTQGLNGVRSINIASQGGSINHAMVIANFARRINMTIFVSEYCLSSCTLILASARNRIGMEKSVYLIHGASDEADPSKQNSNVMPSKTTNESNEMMKNLYIDRGVDESFVRWAVYTPRAGHERLLTKEEALHVGLLTKIF